MSNKTNASKRVTSSRILAKGKTVSNDTWATGINNNDLIVGPSGGGKTRGYVVPNILHAMDSMIVTDTKGNLCNLYGNYLRQKGYKVINIDFKDLANSPCGYNPLNYIRECTDEMVNENGDYYNEQDVQKVAEAICVTENFQDPFWDHAAKMYLEAFILYVLNNLPKEQHDLYEAYTLLTLMGTDEYEDMVNEEIYTHPRSAFTRRYQMIRQNKEASKMDASIKGVLAEHMNVVNTSGMKRLFQMEQQVDLEDFLHRKTALFLNVSDSDRTQDSIVNLFYTQALQFLLNAADAQPDSRLPIPVRFILDDFSTNTVIPDFDNIISVIRSREIYVSLIVQSLSQLEGLYKESKAQTIINNCDHCLYLGGVDTHTAKYFAEKFNCMPSTILNLPLDSMYLFTRGSKPEKTVRYDLDEDKVYRGLKGQRELN